MIDGLERRVLLAGATLDRAFGSNGAAIIDLDHGYDVAYDAVVQKDGKIVVVGTGNTTSFGQSNVNVSVVIRLNVDGSLDDGSAADLTPGDKFGVNGKVFVPTDSFESQGKATTVVLTPDGKIVIAGSSTLAFSPAPQDSQTFPFIARLNANGTPDTAFGNGGVMLVGLLERAVSGFADIKLTADGHLLAAGTSDGDWLTARFTTAGRLDRTFSENGYDLLDWGGTDSGAGVDVDNLGNVVVGGTTNDDGRLGDVGVARYSPTGTLDPNFDADGKAVFFQNRVDRTEAFGLSVRPGGDIVIPGSARLYGNTNYKNGFTTPYLYTFDQRGNRRGYGPGGGLFDGGIGTIDGVAFLADESYLTVIENDNVFGYSPSYDTKDFQGFFGNLDLGGVDKNYAVAVGPDNRVFVVGASTRGGGNNFAVVAFNGLAPPSAFGLISGRVFRDLDGDGVQDANETGLANVRVYVDADNDAQFDPNADRFLDPVRGIPVGERDVLTDAAGNYTISGLLPGTYTLRQVLVSTFSGTLPAGNGSQAVVVNARQTTPGHNFGQRPQSNLALTTKILGNVFNDFDLDGVRDLTNPTEPDIAGRTVYLDSNKNGKPDAGEPQQTTDASGNYLFDRLNPGTYRVRDVLPAGWYHTRPTAGYVDVTLSTSQKAIVAFATAPIDPDDTIAEVVASTKNVITPGHSLDFNVDLPTDVDLVRFTAAAGQKLGFDLDSRDGSTLDTELRLFDSTGKPLAANAIGVAPGETPSGFSYLEYTFAKAGTYYVGVSEAANAAYSAVRGDGDTYAATSTGAYRLTLSAAAAPGTLSGFVFDDADKDGVYDSGETKPSGKTVFLDADNDGVLDTNETKTTSGTNGTWGFTGLPAGTYHVRRVFSSGYSLSTPKIDVNLGAGQTISNLSIGSKSGTTTPTNNASISGFAFDDKNNNGTYDTGDTLASGKTIYLDLDDDGVKDSGEASVVTDTAGKFTFTGLAARQYHVRRVFSTGYAESTPARFITLTGGQAVTGVAIGSKSK